MKSYSKRYHWTGANASWHLKLKTIIIIITINAVCWILKTAFPFERNFQLWVRAGSKRASRYFLNFSKQFHLSFDEIFIISIAMLSLVLAFFHFLNRLLGSGIGSEVVLAPRCNLISEIFTYCWCHKYTTTKILTLHQGLQLSGKNRNRTKFSFLRNQHN